MTAIRSSVAKSPRIREEGADRCELSGSTPASLAEWTIPPCTGRFSGFAPRSRPAPWRRKAASPRGRNLSGPVVVRLDGEARQALSATHPPYAQVVLSPCRVNESLVLSETGIRHLLELDHVVAMRGDCSLPHERISHYLTGIDRYGIYAEAVFGRGSPNGEALPALSTNVAPLDAFKCAANTAPRE